MERNLHTEIDLKPLKVVLMCMCAGTAIQDLIHFELISFKFQLPSEL